MKSAAASPAKAKLRRESWGALTLLFLAGSGGTDRLAAQTPAPPGAGAEAKSISADVVARQLRALAQDTLQGRRMPSLTKPSPALERTAQYVAAEFARLGLQPGNRIPRWSRDTTWIQRYPLPGQARLDLATADLRLTTQVLRNGRPILADAGQPVRRTAATTFTRGARYVSTIGSEFTTNGLVLVAGRQTVASLEQNVGRAGLSEHFVLYVPPADGDAATDGAVRQYLSRNSVGLLLVSPTDSAAFAAQVRAALARPPALPDAYLLGGDEGGGRMIEVWPGVVREALRAAGVDLARIGTDSTPVVRALPLEVELHGEPVQSGAGDVATAPNVIGTLPGTDSTVRHEYVVIVAPLTQDEVSADALGTAGLLALAEAFSDPQARPRRSLVFVAVSGGAPGFWGSRYFSAYATGTRPVPALAVGFDGRGGTGAGRDSVAVTGLDDVAVATRPAWVAAAHPEWGLTVTEAGSIFGHPSDAAAFTYVGIPALALEAAAGAPESAARVVQLAFEVIRAIANGPERPRWSAAGRQGYLLPKP